MRGSSPTNADQQQSIDRSGFPHRIGINWRAGAKLEAKDFMEKWYPAKVVEVDDSDNTVLIHFDGWNQRYDEWLDMDSERIRPMVRHSVRRERREKAKVVVKLPAVSECNYRDYTAMIPFFEVLNPSDKEHSLSRMASGCF